MSSAKRNEIVRNYWHDVDNVPHVIQTINEGKNAWTTYYLLKVKRAIMWINNSDAFLINGTFNHLSVHTDVMVMTGINLPVVIYANC